MIYTQINFRPVYIAIFKIILFSSNTNSFLDAIQFSNLCHKLHNIFFSLDLKCKSQSH